MRCWSGVEVAVGGDDRVARDRVRVGRAVGLDAAAPRRAGVGREERLERRELERGRAPLAEVAGGGELERREEVGLLAELGVGGGEEPRGLEVRRVERERLRAQRGDGRPVVLALGAARLAERGLAGALAPAVGGEVREAERASRELGGRLGGRGRGGRGGRRGRRLVGGGRAAGREQHDRERARRHGCTSTGTAIVSMRAPRLICANT
jgi:hypothetical protein